MTAWKDAYQPEWKNLDGFNCINKQLTSLEGAPARVDGYFRAVHNLLSSLKGAPTYVSGIFDCSQNKLTSLEGAPSHVGKSFFCDSNKLTSLENVHLQIKHIGMSAYFDGNPIESHVLGLLLIDGLGRIELDNKDVRDILNGHLPSKGMESVLLAQEELIMAGYEEYAQL